jgi:hypothetical protein
MDAPGHNRWLSLHPVYLVQTILFLSILELILFEILSMCLPVHITVNDKPN